jgi:glycosyltransferase involved in cell wall biosynthesis
VGGEDIKVSVAMCTFNGAPFVGAQLESILTQSRMPDEIVICDDVSTDETLEIVKKFVARCPEKFRVFRNEVNLGCCRNYESAISRTTGDVIFLCDPDDVWFPGKVVEMLGMFAANPEVVLVYCDAVIADRELRPMGTAFNRRSEIDLRKPPTPRELRHGIAFNGPMIAFHSRLKPFVIPISPLSMQWTPDHWIAFIAYAVGEIQVIDHPLVYYRRHDRNDGGDAEFDGGLWHQWKVVKKKYSGPKASSERRRGWEDMILRLREIKGGVLKVGNPGKLDELLQLSESCLRFAKDRESCKRKNRLARASGAMRLLLAGDYHRYARGVKSFVQDMVIP